MSIMNRFMAAFNIGGNDEEEDYNYNEQDTIHELSEENQYSRRKFSDIEEDSPYSARNINSKVIPMNTGVSSSKMGITHPAAYEDVKEIAEYLKSKKSVIVNLENISMEEARRILDFMSGATFMAEGTIQNVSDRIYLITPKNVEIQNDVEKAEYKEKLSFSWMK